MFPLRNQIMVPVVGLLLILSHSATAADVGDVFISHKAVVYPVFTTSFHLYSLIFTPIPFLSSHVFVHYSRFCAAIRLTKNNFVSHSSLCATGVCSVF